MLGLVAVILVFVLGDQGGPSGPGDEGGPSGPGDQGGRGRALWPG